MVIKNEMLYTPTTHYQAYGFFEFLIIVKNCQKLSKSKIFFKKPIDI